MFTRLIPKPPQKVLASAGSGSGSTCELWYFIPIYLNNWPWLVLNRRFWWNLLTILSYRFTFAAFALTLCFISSLNTLIPNPFTWCFFINLFLISESFIAPLSICSILLRSLCNSLRWLLSLRFHHGLLSYYLIYVVIMLISFTLQSRWDREETCDDPSSHSRLCREDDSHSYWELWWEVVSCSNDFIYQTGSSLCCWDNV